MSNVNLHDFLMPWCGDTPVIIENASEVNSFLAGTADGWDVNDTLTNLLTHEYDVTWARVVDGYDDEVTLYLLVAENASSRRSETSGEPMYRVCVEFHDDCDGWTREFRNSNEALEYYRASGNMHETLRNHFTIVAQRREGAKWTTVYRRESYGKEW